MVTAAQIRQTKHELELKAGLNTEALCRVLCLGINYLNEIAAQLAELNENLKTLPPAAPASPASGK